MQWVFLNWEGVTNGSNGMRMPPAELFGLKLVSDFHAYPFVVGIAALMLDSIADYLATVGAMIALSIPTFWFGLVAIYVFAIKFAWLPAGNMYTVGDGSITDLLQHLILPGLSGFPCAGGHIGPDGGSRWHDAKYASERSRGIYTRG